MKGIQLKPVKQGCTGYFFRGYKNVYATREGKVEQKMGMRLLKRMSCTGCSECGGTLLKELPDLFDCIDIEPIEDGAIYQMWAYWTPGPYEYPDDGDLEFDWKMAFDRNGHPVKEKPPLTTAERIAEAKKELKEIEERIKLLEKYQEFDDE